MKKKKLITYLNYLARGKMPRYTDLGLCANVGCVLGDKAQELVIKHMQTWPKRKDHAYPIEGWSYLYSSNKEKWTGESGKLRRSLCRHIVKKLKKR